MRSETLRILVAPGPYKECLSSLEVAEAISMGIQEIVPDADVRLRPLCDGGSGFMSILTNAVYGKFVSVDSVDPLGCSITTRIGLTPNGQCAIIESASAAGLALVPLDRRNPLETSTYGVGVLIRKAIEAGAQQILIGCGDSGTNDAGVGCAAALGVRFFDRLGKLIENPKGKDLIRIADFDTSQLRLQGTAITVACNLTSILCGPEGTSKIYGPQKGATPEIVAELDAGVSSFVDLAFRKSSIDLGFIPGAGGAGGLAASLYAFCGARLRYSIDVVDEFLQLDQFLKEVDLVFTGEGKVDDRTATGKAACGLALKAKKYNLPVVAVVGGIDQDHEDIYYNGIDAVECIMDGPMSLSDAIIPENAKRLITQAAARVMRIYNLAPTQK